MEPGGILDRLVKSLDLSDEGFSFRKLCSLITLGMVIYVHIKYINDANALNFVFYDFVFICVLLGLVNVDNFIAAKWGGGKPDTTSISSVVSTTTNTSTAVIPTVTVPTTTIPTVTVPAEDPTTSFADPNSPTKQ